MTLDLLEQRRAQLGVPADRVILVRPLLMRGGVVGVACIGLVALAGVWLSWRQSQLQQQVSQLQPAASASEALRQQADGVGRQARRLKAANTQLAEALVSVPSSSAPTLTAPSSVNLIALPTRLSKICCNRAGSPSTNRGSFGPMSIDKRRPF